MPLLVRHLGEMDQPQQASITLPSQAEDGHHLIGFAPPGGCKSEAPNGAGLCRVHGRLAQTKSSA